MTEPQPRDRRERFRKQAEKKTQPVKQAASKKTTKKD